MKRTIIIAVAALCFAIMLGCASTYYEVVTNEGKALVTTEKPEFNKKTQSYEFTDIKGNQWILKREEIKSMEKKEKGS